MGLDMYLRKEYYVKNWGHQSPEERHTITILKGGKPAPIAVDRICFITTEEMYWRKANAIHKWFVDNVQDGKDDCGEYEVEREQLQQLLDIVTQVLAKHDLAKKLLPTTTGFFFGGTDYDEYYYQDLRETKEGLERCLAQGDDGGTFQYHSSW